MSVQVYKSVADIVITDIDLGQVDSGGNTPETVFRKVDNVVVPAGAVVHLLAREEFSTGSTDANYNAAGYWTINGAKSEHWSLFVMCAWGIQRVKADGTGATWVRRQTATNINSNIHHFPADFSEYDSPVAGTYSYETVCYFARSSGYYVPGATVKVEKGYGMITAAVHT